MGVNGLWQIVHPCARPTNLATLNRKRLAVDASIWIYQFLKAVRDKEGNALRNSHVVGFFRRICKLLWFGIRPVFVFDGGAPALKRQTIQGRKRRREGRREDAVRTAGKLLAVQMQRRAEEEEEKRKRGDRGEVAEEPQEEIPSADKIVYMDEVGMSAQERQRTRKFYKQDAYHLPDLDGGITSMGGGNDPRIMSIEELEEYARQFHNGEDINLYDFSNIDFDSDFFRSLPPVDRYNILNAARLRSRLRMGLSKEQLDDMYPDRMAFSRFQIQRVRERNNFTQRLMREAGMSGLDLTLTANGGRIAGDKDREYILVKNEGVEGGWALGVVGKEKGVGEVNNPIDVDALQVRYQEKDDEGDWEDDAEFEDVPVEGLNRLPKLSNGRLGGEEDVMEDEDSLFVGTDPSNKVDELFEPSADERLHPEEEADINRAIALSLQSQYGVGFDVEEDEEEEFEDVEVPEPEWTQKAVEAPRPITTTSGRRVAHIVNNRASAAVPRRRGSDASSDSDDLQAALAASRRLKKAQPVPTHANVKNPFDGPLPFPKLDWNSLKQMPTAPPAKPKAAEDQALEPGSDEEELAGGFERESKDDAPRPLPPWMVDTTDIRESIKKQQEAQNRMNAHDRELAEEEEMMYQQKHQDEFIEIGSSSEDDSDIEIVEIPPSPKEKSPVPQEASPEVDVTHARIELKQGVVTEIGAPEEAQDTVAEKETPRVPVSSQTSLESESKELQVENGGSMSVDALDKPQQGSESPEPVFVDVSSANVDVTEDVDSPEPMFENVQPSGLLSVEQLENITQPVDTPDDDLFTKDDEDEFSDPEEEELLAQMAEEAEEHARFASELNNKSTQENREAYERELRQLRTQQKKDRRDADEVTQVMITECQALLRLFGIPYITAPMEAEAQCAELVSLGLVDGIVTDDSDIFLFGGTRVYKNMFNSAKFVECYLTVDLEKDMSLSREQLIAVAQLLGSDYTEGLSGVGPVTAVEILSEFPGSDGLEKFRDWWKDVQVHNRPKEADAMSSFRKKFRKAQATKLFLPPGFPSPAVVDAYLKPEVDKSMEPFQWGVPDLAGLREFLMTTIGWSQERTDEVLVPVIKDINRRDMEGTQANITRYFGGSVGVGAKEAFAPRQRGKGSRRMAEAVSKLRASTATDGTTASADDGGTGTAKRKRRTGLTVVEDGDGSANDADETVPRGGNPDQQGNKGKRVRAAG